MKARAEDPCGGAGFARPQPCGRRGAQRQRTARAVGKRHVVGAPPFLRQAAERPRHEELDVVGVGRNGHRDVGAGFHHDRDTGRPSRAD